MDEVSPEVVDHINRIQSELEVAMEDLKQKTDENVAIKASARRLERQFLMQLEAKQNRVAELEARLSEFEVDTSLPQEG
jgi:hypothetical protein